MKNAITFLALIICFSSLALFLDSSGQPWWCALNDRLFWTWDTISPHNSQHFIDAYSFSHILHGIVFVWFFGLLHYSKTIQLSLAACLETLWEMLENSPIIIERYRAATISLNYFGDSVANSLSDLACCLIGAWIAQKVGFKKSLLIFVVVEVAMILAIRDSLILNILMLLYPLDSIKAWQSAA